MAEEDDMLAQVSEILNSLCKCCWIYFYNGFIKFQTIIYLFIYLFKLFIC